jgi:hypothetical protein
MVLLGCFVCELLSLDVFEACQPIAVLLSMLTLSHLCAVGPSSSGLLSPFHTFNTAVVFDNSLLSADTAHLVCFLAGTGAGQLFLAGEKTGGRGALYLSSITLVQSWQFR